MSRVIAGIIVVLLLSGATTHATVIINGAVWPDEISPTEVYTDPTTGLTTTVTWTDSDGGGFEQYTSPTSGTGARATDNTYDHDGDPGTAQITITRALELNDDDPGGMGVLTASFTLASSLSGMPLIYLNFGADSRNTFADSGATVEIFNVTDGRFILPNTPVAFDTIANDWRFNEFNANLLSTDFGDVLELRFIETNTSNARGLQVTAINLSVVPEPTTLGILSALAAGLLALRPRRALVAR